MKAQEASRLVELRLRVDVYAAADPVMPLFLALAQEESEARKTEGEAEIGPLIGFQ